MPAPTIDESVPLTLLSLTHLMHKISRSAMCSVTMRHQIVRAYSDLYNSTMTASGLSMEQLYNEWMRENKQIAVLCKLNETCNASHYAHHIAAHMQDEYDDGYAWTWEEISMHYQEKPPLFW